MNDVRSARTCPRAPRGASACSTGVPCVTTIAHAVVTTEKDLVKLAPVPGLEELRALRMTLEVEEGPALLDLLTRPVDLRPV